MNVEEWRPIADHLNYMVSNLGRIKSVARTVRAGPHGGTRFLSEKILKTPVCPATGYPHVVLDRTTRDVHRLVALAFLGPPPFPNAHVNHINSKRHESFLENLEWTTPSGNQLHSYATTNRIANSTGRFGGEHGTSIPVIAICLKTGAETRYEAAMDAVRAGFDSSCISRVCAGLSAHHKGYRWRYADGHAGRRWSRL